MAERFAGVGHRFSIAGQLLGFLWKRRVWWLIPLVVVLLLLGGLLLVAQQSAVAPLIYTLF